MEPELKDGPDRRTLFLFCDYYPFGPGERSFVEPELPYLCKQFDVVLVTSDPKRDEMVLDDSCLNELGISLLVYRSPTRAAYALSVFACLFSAAFWRELMQIIRDAFSFRRLCDSLVTLAMARAFRKFCKKHRVFDCPERSIYYTFWFNWKTLALALEKNETHKLAIVSRIHGADLFNERRSTGRQPFQRYIRDRCSLILFISDQGKRYFEDRFGSAKFEGQYVVNRLGVREQKRIARVRSGDPFMLVSCSKVIPLKRVALIAEALAVLGDRGIEWVHFGGGPEFDRVKRRCSDLGVSALFFGDVDNHDVISFYQTHDIGCFIQLSSSEGLPVSIQEALSCGLPVVATDVGGVSETIDGNGTLLPADCSAEIVAEAINQMKTCSDDEWRHMCERSFELWRERFDAVNCKVQLLKLLKKC